MSDNRWDPEGTQEGLNSLEKLALGYIASRNEADDPEDTMQLALTKQEVALVVFGGFLVNRLFPDLGGKCMLLNQKMMELSVAQDFLPGNDPS
jgi:hypothetical protein